MNRGHGRFVDVSGQCGNGLEVVESSRGVGFDDLDNDGDVDGVVLNSHAPPTILRNDSQSGNHWLQVRLEGTKSNRGAVGARVRVVAGDLVQVAEVHSGRGYQSHFGSRLQFGLGPHENVDRVEVRWPGGGNEVFAGLEADQLVILKEGASQPGE
jgi:enediyne biosynthesis protein E4